MSVRFTLARGSWSSFGAHSPSAALGLAWRMASELKGEPVRVAPSGRVPLLSVTFDLSSMRTRCVVLATGRALTYADALAFLEKVPGDL